MLLVPLPNGRARTAQPNNVVDVTNTDAERHVRGRLQIGPKSRWASQRTCREPSAAAPTRPRRDLGFESDNLTGCRK